MLLKFLLTIPNPLDVTKDQIIGVFDKLVKHLGANTIAESLDQPFTAEMGMVAVLSIVDEVKDDPKRYPYNVDEVPCYQRMSTNSKSTYVTLINVGLVSDGVQEHYFIPESYGCNGEDGNGVRILSAKEFNEQFSLFENSGD